MGGGGGGEVPDDPGKYCNFGKKTMTPKYTQTVSAQRQQDKHTDKQLICLLFIVTALLCWFFFYSFRHTLLLKCHPRPNQQTKRTASANTKHLPPPPPPHPYG